jgi:hemolysin D
MSVAPIAARPAHPLRQLLARHGQVLRAAWAARHELAGPRLLASEAAFLPAALSLQATPVHPAPRRAAAVICALLVVALAWACIGRIDIVAVAQGRIVVSDGSKTLQPLETSVVKAILVKDGDHVSEGQLLVELDATQSQADGTRAGQDRIAAISESLRTRALIAAMQVGAVGIPVLGAPPAAAGWRESDRLDARTQLATEWADISAKAAKLAAESDHRQAEIATADQQIDKLQTTLPMARQREQDLKSLSEQGFVAGHASQDRTRERVEMEKDLATAKAHRAETAAGLAEARQALVSFRSETLRTLRERQSQADLKRQELDQEVAKTTQRTQLARLVSPVAGTVQQLAVHTAGGVVTPAQVLLVVIPDHAQVTAEVQLENRDVGFVREGQHAAIKLETFEFTRYGTIDAEVTTISADAVVDDRRPKDGGAPSTAVFPARLTLARSAIDIDGRQIRLTPGMNVTAEIKTGRRRVIDYLLSPVEQHLGESARER